ncbi:MAG: hypothetical protein DBX40_07380 [Clostridiales bacterium]|nr:MAG: hypothetical protein DBX40_07380 [Clostridiales bacterium]
MPPDPVLACKRARTIYMRFFLPGDQKAQDRRLSYLYLLRRVLQRVLRLPLVPFDPRPPGKGDGEEKEEISPDM